jgi:hypothetical protein
MYYIRKNSPQRITSKTDRIDGLRHSTTTKSPRGAALATLACDTPCKSRLRVQPDQHNKCAKAKSSPKDYPCRSRLRVQPDQHNKCAKSNAAGLAQQARKIEVFLKRLYGQRPTTGAARAHNIIVQIIVTYVQRGHHTLYWLNLQNDTHLPIVKQHYPQLFTLKKTSQLPLTYPNRRG